MSYYLKSYWHLLPRSMVFFFFGLSCFLIRAVFVSLGFMVISNMEVLHNG